MTGQISERAVVLASGGLDSTVTAAVARRDGYALHLLTIAYRQRHAVEVDRSRQVAMALGARQHVVIDVDLRAIGGSALTDDISVPKRRTDSEWNRDVPVTYVPGRNLIFLALAAAHAEVLGASVVYFGANVIDYSGYPDCRPEFVATFEELANRATKAGVEGERFTVHAPLLHMTKADIAREAARLGLDAGISHSCYDPAEDGAACGECDACRLRARGFEEAGLADPTRYVTA
jgi:7-cyano-7-deazaguanine synthase